MWEQLLGQLSNEILRCEDTLSELYRGGGGRKVAERLLWAELPMERLQQPLVSDPEPPHRMMPHARASAKRQIIRPSQPSLSFVGVENHRHPVVNWLDAVVCGAGQDGAGQ